MKAARILLAVETVALLYLASLPAAALPATGLPGPRPGDADHFLAYLAYGILAAASLPGRLYKPLAMGLALGLLTEAMQIFVPTRVFDPLDLLFNFSGLAVAVALWGLPGIRTSQIFSSSPGGRNRSGP